MTGIWRRLRNERQRGICDCVGGVLPAGRLRDVAGMGLKVLAFDTATVTGCAFGVAGGKPRAWSVDLGKAAWPVRFAKTLRMTEAYVERFKPDLVVVEAFVGGPKANTDLAGLVACVLGQASRMGCNTASYYPATIRKHLLGTISKSKVPIKSRVYAQCRLLGWDVPDLDAADAVAAWAYACAVHSKVHTNDIGGLFAKGER